MIRLEKIAYSENRRRAEKARSYDTKYDREIHKRISSWREKRLLRALLARAGSQERLLDVPCGAGRLSPVMADFAKKLYEVDYSHEMVKLSRHNARGYRPLTASASAFQLPFPDGSMDMVVSIRLSHHIPEREARLDHLREIFRTSKRFVLVTFFGEESWKNRLRNLHRRLGGKKRAKLTLRRAEVEAVAAERGFQIVKLASISTLFSGHFFALLEKK